MRNEFFQSRPQGLGDEFTPIEPAYCRQHMGRVGADPATAFNQARSRKTFHHHSQQPVCTVPFGQPVTELAQHREVEASVVQLQAQAVLPVQTAPDGLRRLPVGQILRVLQHRHQRKPGR
ncbi:hypothetical protein OG963_00415 [Streptomyces sp. NBC_01707]